MAKSGHPNVYYLPGRLKYMAQLRHRGKHIYLGLFGDAQSAAEAVAVYRRDVLHQFRRAAEVLNDSR